MDILNLYYNKNIFNENYNVLIFNIIINYIKPEEIIQEYISVDHTNINCIIALIDIFYIKNNITP